MARLEPALQEVEQRQLDIAAVHATISTAIHRGGRFLVARPGVNEADAVRFLLARRTTRDAPLGRPPYPEELRREIEVVAGVTPSTDADLDRFAMTYLDAVAHADLLITMPWTRWMSVLPGVVGVQTAALESLDVYAAVRAGAIPWTRALEGKQVLVVHPFVSSIEAQFARRASISGVSRVLPDFALTTLRPPVTHGGNPDGRTWRDGLERCAVDMSGIDFDVAIIGAGAYGLPLAAHAQSLGRAAIHLAGDTQLLFGIMGGRWSRFGSHADFADETWRRPSPDERPPSAHEVENGAYW